MRHATSPTQYQPVKATLSGVIQAEDSSIFRRARSALHGFLERRALQRRLEGLTDHQLRDMGIEPEAVRPALDPRRTAIWLDRMRETLRR